MAISEQCTAPHIFRQQAMDTRSFAGSLMFVNSSKRTSMVAFTVPDASVAGVWQCIQPWVWTQFVMPAPVPPTGNLWLPPGCILPLRSFFNASHLSLLSVMNSILLRVVNLRNPSQCLSAIAQASRKSVTLIRRQVPTLTVKTSSPVSDVWTRTPGSRIWWWIHLPLFLAIIGG